MRLNRLHLIIALLSAMIIFYLGSLLSLKDYRGIPIFCLYLWAQGEYIISIVQPLILVAAILSTIAAAISALALSINGSDERGALKMWAKFAGVSMGVFWLLGFLTVLFPKRATVNYIYNSYHATKIAPKVENAVVVKTD